MKCPKCGAENHYGASTCWSCGKALSVSPEKPPTIGGSFNAHAKRESQVFHTSASTDELVAYRDIPSKLKIDYMHHKGEPTQKCLEAVQGLFAHFRKPIMNVDDLLLDAANLISRLFGIDNTAIGLRDPKDNLYKYRAIVGFRDDAAEAHRRIVYKKEQFFNDGVFMGTDISKYSRIYLAEDNKIPDEERAAFNRPVLLGMKRRTLSDSMEGDYIDTKIYGPNDDLLGWIEISGTRTMKLPDVTTIRWVETIASIIGAALMYDGARRK